MSKLMISGNSIVRLAAVALCVIGSIAGTKTAVAGEEPRLTSYKFGYSLAVPEGWEQSPQDVVQQLSAASVPGPTAPVYEAALQPKTNSQGTLVGVQVVEYAKFGLNGPLSDDQIQEIIRTVTGLDINALARESLKPEYGSQVNGARIVSSHWDAVKRRFTYAVEMNVNGTGNVRVSAAVYFGRNAMVQLAFSTLAEEWNHNWSVCGQIFESFRFEEPRGIANNGPVAFTSPYPSLFNK